MQDKNKTFQRPPKPGDGTQPAEYSVQEANWFGTAQMPQEEYVENDPSPNAVQADIEDRGPMNEGSPTFIGSSSGASQRSDRNPPSHADDTHKRSR